MNFNVIEPVMLCEAEEKQLAAIMAAGNTVLKESHEKAPSFSGSRCDFRKELFRATKNWKDGLVRVEGVLIWSADLRKIKEVEKNQYRIIQGVSNFMLEMSKKWKNRTGHSIGENYDEAVLSVINCIYCYTDTTVKFCTYAGNAITKRFIGLQRCNKSTSHWTNVANKLYGDYEKFRQVAEQQRDENGNPHGALTFDEIAKMMKLNDEQRSTLQAMFSGVINHSEMQGVNDEGVTDYTSNRQGIDHEEQASFLDLDQREVLAQVNDELDDWEKAVLKAWLESSSDNHGWRTIVAGENINPNTGRNYSRAAPSIALERVKEKILRKYNELNAA